MQSVHCRCMGHSEVSRARASASCCPSFPPMVQTMQLFRFVVSSFGCVAVCSTSAHQHVQRLRRRVSSSCISSPSALTEQSQHRAATTALLKIDFLPQIFFTSSGARKGLHPLTFSRCHVFARHHEPLLLPACETQHGAWLQKAN